MYSFKILRYIKDNSDKDIFTNNIKKFIKKYPNINYDFFYILDRHLEYIYEINKNHYSIFYSANSIMKFLNGLVFNKLKFEEIMSLIEKEFYSEVSKYYRNIVVFHGEKYKERKGEMKIDYNKYLEYKILPKITKEEISINEKILISRSERLYEVRPKLK